MWGVARAPGPHFTYKYRYAASEMQDGLGGPGALFETGSQGITGAHYDHVNGYTKSRQTVPNEIIRNFRSERNKMEYGKCGVLPVPLDRIFTHDYKYAFSENEYMVPKQSNGIRDMWGVARAPGPHFYL